MRRWLTIAAGAVFALAGCGGESHQDLRAWMAAQGAGAKGKLDPLPQMKPYEPFAYNAFDLPDPFKPRKIEPTKGNDKLAPDLARRREPLESFPLESLSMVGTLAKEKAMYALVRTPDKDIYQVRSGNFMGQNFGVVIGISDTEIKLKELVQDSAGDWTERSSSLQLQQPGHDGDPVGRTQPDRRTERDHGRAHHGRHRADRQSRGHDDHGHPGGVRARSPVQALGERLDQRALDGPS